MKTDFKHFVSFSLLLCALLAVASCKPEEKVDDFSFDVTMSDGSAISGTQTLNYAQEALFTVVPVSVASTEVKAPEGWKAVLSMSKKTLTVTSPDPTDAQAAISGNVVVTATGAKGATKSVTIAVAVVDAAIEYKIKDDVSAGISVLYGSTTTLGAESSNVDAVVAAAPKGWTVNADATSVVIVAPNRDATDIETSGNVVLSPYSAAGNAGTNVTVAVEISVKAPYMEFSPSSLSRVDFGSSTVVTVTKVENVAGVELKSAPKGWTFSADFANMKATVTAPASASADYEGAGEIVVTATSTTGDKLDFSLPVTLKGINSAADFCAFGDAFTDKVGDLSDFCDGETVVLNADIDLAGTPRNIYVGNDTVYFNGAFDGKNHTINMEINATDACAGLFSVLGENASVKNLNLSGSITSDFYNEESTNGTKIGVLAIYDLGSRLESINSSVSVNYSAAFSGGYLGGLVAINSGQTSVYTACRMTGAITVKGMRYIGGLIGLIESDGKGEMTNCSNGGKFTLDYSASASTGKQRIGGLVGCADKCTWSFNGCSNTGDFDYTCKGDDGLYSLGGFIGDGSGSFTNCFNEGNITDKNGTKTVKGTRRIGGFIGSNVQSGYPAVMNGCYNAGNVSGCSNYIGGFIGISENQNSTDPCSLTYCYNRGSVTVISETTISGMFGGFAGVFYGSVRLDGCANSGKVYGYTNRSAGGFIGCGADDLVINNCQNTGEVDIHTAAAGLGDNNFRPFVAGLVAVRGTNPVVITNCANTGSVTGEVQKETSIASAYVSEKEWEAGNTDRKSVV